MDQNSHKAEYYRERGRAKYNEKNLLLASNGNGSISGFKCLSSNNYKELYGADKYKEAIDDYKIALELNPNDALCYLYLADTVNTVKDKVKYYDLAIQVKPDYIDAYDAKITEYCEYRLWDDAIETMHQMIKKNPKNKKATALFNSYKNFLGKTYEQYSSAITD